MSIKETITDLNSENGRRFDISIQILIVLSLIAFSLETLPNLDETTVVWLDYFEIFCVIIFSIEYVDGGCHFQGTLLSQLAFFNPSKF